MGKSKSLLLLALIFLSFILTCTGFIFYEGNAQSSQPIVFSNVGSILNEDNSFLHTTGINIYDSNNEQVIWNGITTPSLFGYEMYASGEALGESISVNDIDIIRSHGSNFVRLDIQLNTALYGQPASSQNPTSLTYYTRFFSKLDEVVTRASQLGMWVHLNFAIGSVAPLALPGWPSGNGWGVQNGFPKWMYDGSWSYFNKIYPNDGVGVANAIRDFWNIDDPTAANVRIAYQTFWKDIATHFKDTPNVVFGLFNEPQSSLGASVTIWQRDQNDPITQDYASTMFKLFMEDTIDKIRAVEGGKHLIIVQRAYFWFSETNKKVDRPDVIFEDHAYHVIDQSLVNLGWRYNQPFILGEFGGIEEGEQDAAGTVANIQFCNSINVSWVYLHYRADGSEPSPGTWTNVIDPNLHPDLKYYVH